MAGDPYDFDKVNPLLQARRSTAARAGRTASTTTARPASRTPTTPLDPSIGMAHLTFQIQDGKQVLISPDPYTTGQFQLPAWLA